MRTTEINGEVDKKTVIKIIIAIEKLSPNGEALNEYGKGYENGLKQARDYIDVILRESIGDYSMSGCLSTKKEYKDNGE